MQLRQYIRFLHYAVLAYKKSEGSHNGKELILTSNEEPGGTLNGRIVIIVLLNLASKCWHRPCAVSQSRHLIRLNVHLWQYLSRCDGIKETLTHLSVNAINLARGVTLLQSEGLSLSTPAH